MEPYSFFLSKLIESVTTENFSKLLLCFLKSKFHFENAIAFHYHASNRPLCILECDRESINNYKILYEQGAYLDDPFYLTLRTIQDINVIKLNEIAPKNFFNSDYFKNFYQKIGWSEEIGIILKINNTQTTGFFFSHFSSKNKTLIRKNDIQETFTIIKSLLKLHLKQIELTGSKLPNNQISTIIPVQNEFIQLKKITNKLTAKERQIADLILCGYTSSQIAKNLFIAVGTVKNHRKNIYAKLGINSQCALFALFNTQHKKHLIKSS